LIKSVKIFLIIISIQLFSVSLNANSLFKNICEVNISTKYEESTYIDNKCLKHYNNYMKDRNILEDKYLNCNDDMVNDIFCNDTYDVKYEKLNNKYIKKYGIWKN